LSGSSKPSSNQEPETIRVYAVLNVLGLRKGEWGDVPVDMRDLDECKRRKFVLVEGPNGEPAPAHVPPRRCCGH
jgi:hypothetical protein